MALDDKRARRRELQARLDTLQKTVVAQQRDRRELRETSRSKKKRDPANDARADLLDHQIKELHAEIRDINKRIHDLRSRGKKVRDALQHVSGQIAAAIKRRHSGSKEAVRWAIGQNGVHESPPGSNWGHPVQDWIQGAGYTYAVPWCGCFAHEAVVVHGRANVTTQLGYAGNIITDAQGNRNGLRQIPASAARAGDVASLWGAEHVVTLRGPVSGSTFPTVEGNTSASNGSQTNGGEVALKVRNVSDVDVFARPDYPEE